MQHCTRHEHCSITFNQSLKRKSWWWCFVICKLPLQNSFHQKQHLQDTKYQLLSASSCLCVDMDFKTFCLLFKSLVRPILEYASSVWNPYKTKDIEAIENVQRRATKMLPDMKDLTYEERLKKLKLPSLRYRRLRGDMIETFKIVTEIYDKRVTEDLLPINKSTFHQTRRPKT